MSILEIKNLTVTFHTKDKITRAVNNISLSVEEQDSIGIVGESGSGKSTLVMAILQLLPKRIARIEGEVILDGNNLFHCTDEQIRRIRWRDLAVVFQKSMNALSPVHKIGTQMSDIYRIHESKISKKELKEKMISLLEMVNLPPRVYELYPHELSGGMMQRVSIALSLMHNPKLLILDEATTALDVVTQGQILSEIKELEKELNLTRIMITHDMSVVASACKKVAVMYAGNILEFGYVKDVLVNPLHPYTQGLLKSIPTFKGEKKNIRGIAGALPDLSVPIQGCIFANRCEFATDICYQIKPTEELLSGNHRVACHLVGGMEHANVNHS
ncbi:ABC transporter ATP-binding protein [Robertmurraya sp. DFI.2.37]|nr:ABC transporter ATP-binding protein [Robertmurraya sp. DFI.2.37]MDF1507245.1 ABC transporter ATP-binding protein [Robertmurraya sp. DFI.2.37]